VSSGQPGKNRSDYDLRGEREKGKTMTKQPAYEVGTTNPRHFTPIAEIHVRRFPED
jgi:hypothetical protein